MCAVGRGGDGCRGAPEFFVGVRIRWCSDWAICSDFIKKGGQGRAAVRKNSTQSKKTKKAPAKKKAMAKKTASKKKARREVAAESGGQGQDLPIVGIGASAGGLEAIEGFFSHTPEGIKIASVIIQHLAPEHKSM